jgi:hypothetical protein
MTYLNVSFKSHTIYTEILQKIKNFVQIHLKLHKLHNQAYNILHKIQT